MIKKPRPQNAVQMLKADHRLVEDLFEKFESARTSNSRLRILDQIITELSIHATVEEKLVYPLLEQEGQDAEEAYEEHHVVKLMLAELADADAQAPHLKAKVKVLSELVQHHVEEEETMLLPKLKKEYEVDLNDLGMKIEQMKQELKGNMKGIDHSSKKQPGRKTGTMSGGRSSGMRTKKAG